MGLSRKLLHGTNGHFCRGLVKYISMKACLINNSGRHVISPHLFLYLAIFFIPQFTKIQINFYSNFNYWFINKNAKLTKHGHVALDICICSVIFQAIVIKI